MPSRRDVLFAGAGVGLFGFAGYNVLADGDSPLGGGGSEEASVAHADVPVGPVSATTDYDVDLAGTPVVGPDDAAVDVYYWSDYQCPFCRRFEQKTFPKLAANELSSGTARLALLQFPNIGSASRNASTVSRAVWSTVKGSDPDAFLAWHAAVFDAQGEPNSGWATTEKLLGIAESTGGVDAAAVRETLTEDADALRSAVEDEREQGEAKGVGVTPTFLLYDRESGATGSISGAQPYPRFQSALAEVQSG